MRKVIVALALLATLAAGAQWSRTEVGGESICQRETGEQFDPTYDARSTVTIACNVLNQFEQWFIRDAAALTLRFTLRINSDGTFDTAFPDGDKDSTPSAPVISATAINDTRIDISLVTGCSGGTAPYTIALQRGTDPSNLAEIDDDTGLAVGETAYQVTGLTAETTYHFGATCTDSAAMPNVSVLSAVVSATTQASSADSTPPSSPGNATVSDITATSARCTWTAATDNVGVDHYDLYYGTGNGSGAVQTQLGLYGQTTGLSILLTGLDPDQEYYCRPTAFDAAGNSATAASRTFFTTLDDAPSGNIIFRETFEGMAEGTYSSVSGRWSTSSNPNGSVQILSSNPVGTGFGKYMRPRLVRPAGGISARAEYSAVALPSGRAQTTSGHDTWSTQGDWYGYILCIDNFDMPGTGSDEAGGNMVAHFNQWHEWGDGQWNPLISLVGNAAGLNVYMERNEENPIQGNPNNTGPDVNSPTLYDPTLGQCFKVIWQIRFDSRRSTEGSQGILRIWVGHNLTGSSSPSWEWVGKANQHKLSTLLSDWDNGQPHGGENIIAYNKIGGYLSGWANVGDTGDTYEARYDNYTVMDSTGSLAAMIAALDDPD